MKSTRRTFLKGAGATGAAVAAARFAPIAIGQNGNGATAAAEDTMPTTCWIGKQDCAMIAHRVDGRVIKFEGNPADPRTKGSLCPKGKAQLTGLYDPNRLTKPMIRKEGSKKGETGQFEEVSWEKALDLVAKKIKEVRKEDPELVLWQKGRSKAKVFYDEAFVDAMGCQKMGHGAYCSDAGYRGMEYTVGLHGVMHPDFRYNKYLLSWGWNITNAGGNKTCWQTWNRQLVAARDKQLEKIVQIDPRIRPAGPHADEWVAIKPGTDMALALALSNRLIKQGDIDKSYLRKHTNAPYLVKKDGEFLKVNGKEQVWDTGSGGAVAAGKSSKPALEGTFTVNGKKVKPGFQLFKEHVSKATPKWAAEICGIDADAITQIAKEFGETADIGATKTIDGKTIPYRPVAIMAYHMAQQELGMQTLRAMLMVTMLVGAFGAVGGQKVDWKAEKPYKNWEDFDDIAGSIEEGPYGVQLKHSKFFPINTGCPGVASDAMNNPKKWEADPKKFPKLMIQHMVNPIVAFPDQDSFMESYKKFEFIAVLTPWLNETADYFADVVLPAAGPEKYEGPSSVTDQYVDGKALRMPVTDPLGESRSEINIYMDLCEKVGILFGKEGYLYWVNIGLELGGPKEEVEEPLAGGKYALPLNKKPKVKDIFNRWAKGEELEGGIKFFEKNGVWDKGEYPPEKVYGYVSDPVFAGVTHRFYGETLLTAQKKQKSMNTPKQFWQDYTAFPTWREATFTKSPAEYNLDLISYKLIEFKQARAVMFPMLREIAPEQILAINPEDAKAKDIGDGDEVTVESQNSVTEETRSVKVKAVHRDDIRPGVVGMPHHYGMWMQPWSKDAGPTPNKLFFTGEGYVSNTADQTFQVRVKVKKA